MDKNYVTVTRPELLIAGDWHGNTRWGVARIAQAAALGEKILFHSGDFNLVNNDAGELFLREIEQACATHDITCYVTPGNHEDWATLLATPKLTKDTMGDIWWMSPHVAALPRGHRFSIKSADAPERSVVSLGGAPSINFETSTLGGDWWVEEVISQEDVLYVSKGGYADIMLTHDAPGEHYEVAAVANIRTSNPQGWSETALAYAREGKQMLTEAFKNVAPQAVVHGHFHMWGTLHTQHPDGSDCFVVSLGGDERPGNLAGLDLNDLKSVVTY